MRGVADAAVHRIFTEGRWTLFHGHRYFRLQQRKTFLMGGGIGITPMIAFARMASNRILCCILFSKNSLAFLNVINVFHGKIM